MGWGGKRGDKGVAGRKKKKTSEDWKQTGNWSHDKQIDFLSRRGKKKQKSDCVLAWYKVCEDVIAPRITNKEIA